MARVITRVDGPSQTVKSEGHDCNINTIVGKLRRGLPVDINKRQPLYGDFSMVVSYPQAIMRLQEINEDFMTIPAEVRLRFGNDPQKLLEFIQDDNNRAEAISLGLVENIKPEKKPETAQKSTEIPSDVIEEVTTITRKKAAPAKPEKTPSAQ